MTMIDSEALLEQAKNIVTNDGKLPFDMLKEDEANGRAFKATMALAGFDHFEPSDCIYWIAADDVAERSESALKHLMQSSKIIAYKEDGTRVSMFYDICSMIVANMNYRAEEDAKRFWS